MPTPNHYYAVQIEHIFQGIGYASYQDANEVEEAPINFCISRLNAYKKNCSSENRIKIEFFCNKYKDIQNKHLYDMSEDDIIEIINDLRTII